MDPIIGASLISGASSLLGGLFGRPKEKWVTPNYADIRAKAEAAGFNPLTALQMAPGQAMQTSPVMGAAIANAGMAIADGISKKAELGRLEKLAQENQKLAEKVQALTIRPKVGGVYAQREVTPSLRATSGGGGYEGGARAEKTPVDLSSFSPLAGTDLGPDDDDLTGVQLAVKDDVPAFRMFGHDFYGSGLFSTGQQVEDAVGEGPLQWLYSPLVVGDAVLNEAYKAGGAFKDYQTRKKASFYIDGAAFSPAPYKAKRKPDTANRWNNSRPMFGGGF